MAQYMRNHSGYERAWLGPWEHVRGNERDEDGRLKMGRAGFFDEVVRFYDRFLKGTTPAVAGPAVAVQTNDGKWRAEQAWPPADATELHHRAPHRQLQRRRLGLGHGPSDTEGVWTISPPLPHAAHLSGSGQGDRRRGHDAAERQPRRRRLRPRRVRHRPADHAPGLPGPLRAARRRSTCGRPTGRSRPGHRIAVRVTDANEDWWIHTPTVRHRQGGRRLRDAAVPHATRGRTRSRATRARSSRTTWARRSPFRPRRCGTR